MYGVVQSINTDASALGYTLVAATLVWFSALAIGLLMAGQNISTLFG